MNKYLPTGILAILLLSVFAIATPNFPVVDVVPSKGHASVGIPETAVEVAEGVFSLGSRTDVDGRVVEGIAFVDYKKENAKPPWAGGGKGKGESSCFAFLSKGAKWKTVEDYIVDPTNDAGLDESFVRNNLAADIQEWEDAAGTDILGNEVAGVVDIASIGNNLNGENEVIFADVESEGAIAVTIVWGVFSGPPFARELVEWDQVYDDVDFAWSSNPSGEAGKMDFENIAQHELGHSIGMGHPESGCTEETMYAFADFEETKKRDLNTGDIAGVNELYA